MYQATIEIELRSEEERRLMMNKLLAMIPLLGIALMGGSAQAVDAGWDFSQFAVPGSLTGGSNPLAANYSAQDPNGAGTEAAAFGSASWSGTLLPIAADGPRVPFARGLITANLSEPFELGETGFEAFGILASEGQANTTRYAMQAATASTVEFEVTPVTPGATVIATFGHRTAPGTSAGNIGVSLDVDCGGPGTATPVAVTPVEARAEVALGSSDADTYCVYLAMDEGTAIDNVAFVPEPGLTAQCLAAVATLGLLARRRRR